MTRLLMVAVAFLLGRFVERAAWMADQPPPPPTKDEMDTVQLSDDWWVRIQPYLSDSHTIN